uniref:Prune exopolyphosphatase n=1 Tax=Haplochromis burtoni TaxID=8153 RepID=A0A3Q2VBH7_HAPBU
MEEFLTSCQRAVKVGPGFHVVLGNEACDIDSMVSALAYAYFLSKVSHSPISQFLNLNYANSHDHWPFSKTISEWRRGLRVHLLPSYNAVIAAIPQLSVNGTHAAIVVDCVDMSPAAGKVTPKDSQYAAALENLFPALPPRGALFQELHRAKLDVSGQFLRIWTDLFEFLQREDLEAELSGFCQKYGYDLLLLMTIFFTESKEPIRELAVFSHSTTCREQYLEQAQSPALNLSPLSSPHSHISAYHQGNTPVIRHILKVVCLWGGCEQRRGLRTDGDFITLSPGNSLASRKKKDELSQVPPTPMNSLVEGSPLDNGLPRITSQALEEKFTSQATEVCKNTIT